MPGGLDSGFLGRVLNSSDGVLAEPGRRAGGGGIRGLELYEVLSAVDGLEARPYPFMSAA
jgi:hypothetical protein